MPVDLKYGTYEPPPSFRQRVGEKLAQAGDKAAEVVGNVVHPSTTTQKVVSGVVLTATAVPAVLGVAAGIADATSNNLPKQQLDRFEQNVPKSCDQEAIDTALQQYRSGERPVVKINADELYETVERDAAKVLADRGQAGAVEDNMCEVVETLHPVIHVKTDALNETEARLEKANEEQGWFRRTFNDTKEVDQLQNKVEDQKEELVELRGVHGGASIVLTADDDLSGNIDALRAQFGSDVKAVEQARGGSHEGWVEALAREAQNHAALKEAVNQGASTEKDLTLAAVDFKEAHTNWGNRVGWVDTMTGGRSIEGELHRESKSQVKESGATLDKLQALKGQSETALYNGINELLKVENPRLPNGSDYRQTRAEYDRLLPVHDDLNDVMNTSKEALDALDHAEWAIAHRNAVKMREPPQWETVQETYTDTHYDSDGNPYTETHTRWVTRETAAHQAWESEMRMAEMQAAAACESAERRVREMNSELAELKASMKAAGISQDFGSVSSEISWYFGQNFSWGFWSYDSGQVNSIQRQVNDLRTHVAKIQGEVDAKFHPLEKAVWEAIYQREGELLAMPLTPPAEPPAA